MDNSVRDSSILWSTMMLDSALYQLTISNLIDLKLKIIDFVHLNQILNKFMGRYNELIFEICTIFFPNITFPVRNHQYFVTLFKNWRTSKIWSETIFVPQIFLFLAYFFFFLKKKGEVLSNRLNKMHFFLLFSFVTKMSDMEKKKKKEFNGFFK